MNHGCMNCVIHVAVILQLLYFRLNTDLSFKVTIKVGAGTPIQPNPSKKKVSLLNCYGNKNHHARNSP